MYTPQAGHEFAETFSRVCRLTKRLVPREDYEELAAEIISESWANDVPQPSQRFVRQRAINVIRRSALETRTRERASAQPQRDLDSVPAIAARQELVEQLLLALSPTERKLIHARFFLGKTYEEIATAFRLDVMFVSQSIATALYKMREMGDGA